MMWDTSKRRITLLLIFLINVVDMNVGVSGDQR